MSNWLCEIFNFSVGPAGAAAVVVFAVEMGAAAPFFAGFAAWAPAAGPLPTSSIRTGM
jgi:hypothetical protein